MASSARVAHDIFNDNVIRTQDIEISENIDFEGLHLSQRVLKGLKNAGFLRPSPIQLKSIPLGRCGLDLIVQAKAGTGKTCVFTVIALEGLQVESSATQVLVLAPTREIAYQIWQVITSIGSGFEELTCATFIGGISVAEDKENLKKCHIAVGTPGRIKFLIEQNYLKTKSIRLFVLDEADQLLDECFQADINWIYSVLPENKQVLALSATYPEFMTRHLLYYMRNPTYIRLDVTQLALLGIKQYYVKIPFHPHVQKAAEYSYEAAIKIISSVSFNQCLIFSNLQSGAQSLAFKLEEEGWPTCCIAGSLEQKERNEAMASLKAFQCRILISTDLTSRGIDAENVNLVINLDLPRKPRVYLHRIGRAGRFGSQGAAISLVPGNAGLKLLKRIQMVCNTTLEPLPDPIPSDLVSTPCQKSRIRLDDIVHTETLSTENSIKGAKRSPQRSRSDKPSPVISDTFNQITSSENPCTAAERGTRKLEDKVNHDLETPGADSLFSILSQKSEIFSENLPASDFHGLEISDVSIKKTETRKSSDSQAFPNFRLPCRDFPLVNQTSVSPWQPTEVPQFKQVPSPGSYSDLCSQFELFTLKGQKKNCEDFQSALPLPSSSEISLKGVVSKQLDAYYKKICQTMLSNIGEVKSDHDSLQVSSLKMINNNPDQQINLNCENNNVRIDVTELYESQKLVIDIGHESLEIFSGFLENKDVGTKKHQNEKNSQTGLKSDPSDSKKAKNYRHLFRHEDDEYFVPDYLVDQVGDEKLQSENSQRQTADKKEPPNSLPRKKKTDTISVEKDVRTKRNVDKDQNDETLRDEAQPSLIIPGNQKHTRKLSRQKTLSDTSSSELDEFSDSNTSSSVSSSSFFSDSSSEEQKIVHPYGYPLMYSQHPYPYTWTQGYPIMTPMYLGHYWTCPNYYYGYPVPFTQPANGHNVTSDPYSAMKLTSHNYFQQQQNYIKWMTRSYLGVKQ